MTPRWLDDRPNRGRVLSFAQAQLHHGGDGALYVLLRRARTRQRIARSALEACSQAAPEGVLGACVTSMLGQLLPRALLVMLAAGPAWAQPAGGADARSGQVAAAAALRPGRQDLDRAGDRSGGRAEPRRGRAVVGGGAGRDLLRGRPGGAEGAARDPRCGGPGLPQELAAAEARLFADLEATGWLRVLLLLAAFVGFGYGCEWLFWRATAALRERIMASPLDTPARAGAGGARPPALRPRLVLAFALGSIGAFLRFPGRRACARWSWATCWPSWRCGSGMVAGAISVRAAAPALPRRADERRCRVALVPRDRSPSSAGMRSASSPSSCCAASASASRAVADPGLSAGPRACWRSPCA